MLNLCGIVAAILKMATARNFSMSGIYSGHHNLPTNEMSLKSDNVEFVRYCGGHFENRTLIFYVPLVRGRRIDKLQNSFSSKSTFGSVSKGRIRRVMNISNFSSHMMDLYSGSSLKQQSTDMLLH